MPPIKTYNVYNYSFGLTALYRFSDYSEINFLGYSSASIFSYIDPDNPNFCVGIGIERPYKQINFTVLGGYGIYGIGDIDYPFLSCEIGLFFRY